MIEELTPPALSALLLFVIAAAPLLTLAISALLLWQYRRAVTRQMELSRGFSGTIDSADRSDTPADAGERNEPAMQEIYSKHAAHGPWRVLHQYAIAGLALALVFALAAREVYPYQLGLPGFLLGVWIYAWPIAFTALLIIPATWRVRLAILVIYFTAFLMLTLWAGTVLDIPASQFGAIQLPARSSATPPLTLRLWLVVNAAPTVLLLFCLNRWAAPIAPLVLGLVTTALSGTLVIYLLMFSRRGIDAYVAIAVWLNLHPGWLVYATLIISLLLFGALGWVIMRVVTAAYQRKWLSDQSVMLGAIWLVFASYYAMWLVLGGLVWAATAPIAFVTYLLTLAMLRKLGEDTRPPARGLTFLRVFSLGRRSERLLAGVTQNWRHIGSVQIITGPDVAGSTVQPHQFLDFLSRKLSDHFVKDSASLEQSIASCDRALDPDGRFRINNFFCHADSWQQVLARLVQQDDVVLMDLRNFSAANAGCIHELNQLVHHVPLNRCLLVVDETTDEHYLEQILEEIWQDLPPDSPNLHRSRSELSLQRAGREPIAPRQIVERLCAAAATVSSRNESAHWRG